MLASRRIFTLAVLAGLCREAATGQENHAGTESPPNVVLVVVDDLGWSDLACYGGDLHETPRIDALAREGLRFTRAYAAAPVCSPTRASIMTGKSPARLHMTIWYESSADPPHDRKLLPPVTVGNLPHEEVTLAEVLSAAGYFTAHIGKWHLGDAAHYPETHGFDVNVAGTFWGAPPTFFYPYRGYWSNTRELRYVPDLEGGEKGEYLTDRLTDEALRILASASRPFFLHLAYHSVHTPIEAPAEDVARYEERAREALHHKNPVYAAMVSRLDRNVGRLLDALDQFGLAENTAFFLISDNGGFINVHRGQRVTSNAPLRSGKGSLYEGGIRVPLIVRWPNVTPPGTQCDVPVSSADLYPTILRIAAASGSVAESTEVDGIDLTALLRSPGATLPERRLYWHYPHYYPTTTPVSAVLDGRWKLLEYFEDNRVELYNLAADPGETRDLSASEPRTADRLRGALQRWRKEVGAQLPAKNPAR